MAELPDAQHLEPEFRSADPEPTDYDPLEGLRGAFLLRLARDAAALLQEQMALDGGVGVPATLGRMRHLAHGLSGAAGIYGFAEVSDAAADLEDAVIAKLAARGPGEAVIAALGKLISHIERCCHS